MKIPHSAIPDCYKYAKEAFEGKITPVDATMKINEKQGIEVGSAKDYFYFLKYLITGEGSCRILNLYTQEYFIKRIRNDYDKEQFTKSLNHFKKLIEKFEKDKVGSKKSMWKIYEKYSKLD